MTSNTIETLTTNFESFVNKTDEKIEFWYARDLQHLLGYTQWRNFQNVIFKAQTACEVSGYEVLEHFADVSKMVEIGSGTKKEIQDLILTRYACYLIAQNGDSSKEPIAFAQTYFAVQTRKQEIIEQRLELEDRLKARKKLTSSETELSKNIYERGVDSKGFGRIRSKGDNALFGGFTTQNMKDKLNIPKARALADFLPTVTITAKNLATEITNHNVKEKNLNGEQPITQEHVTNNKNVRQLLSESGIKPEELEASKDLKKLEREVKSDEKKLVKQSSLLKIKKPKSKKL